jgi:hypothetical protein
LLAKQQPLLRLTQPFTVEARKSVFLRLYSDSRPHCLEIATLQKGLVLVLDGKELVEEGVGFGVPVVKFGDNTHFSSSALTFISKNEEHPTLVKSFSIDTVSRKRIWKGPYIDDGFYSLLQGLFEEAYLRRKRQRLFFDKIMELRNVLKINTEFVKVKPRGTINLKYSVLPELIRIEVDLSALDSTGRREILILNEQGSSFFRKYFDSDGLVLFDKQIGAWEPVEAAEASLSDIRGNTGFMLKNKDGGRLYRGSEKVKERFSWSGLNYSLPKDARFFTYEIALR